MKRIHTFKSLIVVIVFVFAGVLIWAGTHAATPFLAVEPEGGTVSTPALSVTDATASGSQAIAFKSAITPPPPAGAKLSWAPPVLNNPITIVVDETHMHYELDDTKDYRIVLPNRKVIVGSGTNSITINNGRNIVMIGGELSASGNTNGAIRFKQQTGTVHIEGVRISGPNLGEAFQFWDVKGTIQMENVFVDDLNMTNPYCGPGTTYHHCDMFQIWGGGPAVVRMDRFTGSTTYQAFMLQNGEGGQWDLRNIDIRHHASPIGDNGWVMFDVGPFAKDMKFSNVYFYGMGAGAGVYSLGRNGTMPGLSLTQPATSFVNPASVGVGYVSPGYL